MITVGASLAQVARTLPSFRPPRIMHSMGFYKLGRAGRQLYEILWVATGFGSYPIKIRDWELARLCGRCLRWVQKALRQLLDRKRDDEPAPIIDRFRVYGSREDSGRVIEIVDADALPDPKPPPRPKPPPKATTPPKATPPPVIPAATNPPREAEPVPAPADGDPAEALAALKAQIEAAKAERRAEKTGGPAAAAVPGLGIAEARAAAERQIAAIEAIEPSKHVPFMVAELARLRERLAALDAGDQAARPALE